MPDDKPFRSLDFTPGFLDDLTDRREFNRAEVAAFRKALRLLDENERHPSLRVHELQGSLAGVWSASAPDELRLTFRRRPDGRRLLLTCSHHYER